MAHVGGHVIGRKIQRNFLVSPQNFAMAHFQAVDGERKELLDRLLRRGLLQSRLGLVGGAVGIKNDVDDGMVENNVVKPDLSPQD